MLEERQEEVRVIVARDTLHRCRDALEPRPRVDRRLGQWNERAVRLPIELHEHEVPDLEEPPRLRAFDERFRRELLPPGLGPFARRVSRERPILREEREIDVDL